MPTHRDHPWERDARARAGDEGPPTTAVTATRWWAWAALVAIGVLVLVLKLDPTPRTDEPTMVGQGSAAAAARTSELAVRGLRSRFMGERRLRVWGSASAPPGAEVRVRVRIASAWIDIPRSIRVGSDGLFEGVVDVPEHHHRGTLVQAVLVPGLDGAIP